MIEGDQSEREGRRIRDEVEGIKSRTESDDLTSCMMQRAMLISLCIPLNNPKRARKERERKG